MEVNQWKKILLIKSSLTSFFKSYVGIPVTIEIYLKLMKVMLDLGFSEVRNLKRKTKLFISKIVNDEFFFITSKERRKRRFFLGK